MDLLSAKANSTPQQFAHLLIEKGPIFWAEIEKFWVVTDMDLAQSILKGVDFSADRSAFFMSRMSGCPFHKVANFFSVVKKMMVTSDPPEHTARRKLGLAGINDHIIDDFAPAVCKVVDQVLAGIKPGRIDFVQDIALPLPNIILAEMFSVPQAARPDFYRWSNHMTQFFGGASADIHSDAANADTGAANLREYFQEMIQQRRRQPQNDFISHLVKNQGGLDDSEVISQAAIMLVAGTVTTTDQICNNLNVLLHSGIWAKLVAQPALLEAAIEEATRLDPSVNFIFRVAARDLTLGGKSIQAGQLVFISTHATNRNAVTFSRPDNFSLDRTRNPHLAYGAGIHHCLGARLGRIQMRALFASLLETYPDLSVDADHPPVRKHQSLAFSGFETFPVRIK